MRSSLFVLLVLLSSCQQQKTEVYRQTLLVFGTLTEIDLYQTSYQNAQKTFRAINHYFQQKHKQWHAWQGNGMLMQINQAIANGQAIKIDAETEALIRQSKKISRLSGGYFDPGIGKLIALWGFHQSPEQWHYPDRQELRKLINNHVGIANIVIKDHTLSSNNSNVSIDLGGIAKGYLAQKALQIARENGIVNAIINAGGDVCVSGSAKDRPWNIAVRHPDKKHILASVKLQSGECLMTSGGYERFYQWQGKHFSHIINPRTGLPVENMASVSVIANNGALADATATALSIASAKEQKVLYKKLSLAGIITLNSKEGLFVSPEISNRVDIIYQKEQQNAL